MKINKTVLQDACIIKHEPFKDKRGVFSRIFCKKELSGLMDEKEVVQVNYSVTNKKGTIRGIHFQHAPKAEKKIIKCIGGSVFDVIIDLRKGSPTFLKWHGEILTEDNMKMIYVPEGFAHGFQAMDNHSRLIYFHTQYYEPDYEGGIRYDDPQIGIKWPLEVTEISDRDLAFPLLPENIDGILK